MGLKERMLSESGKRQHPEDKKPLVSAVVSFLINLSRPTKRAIQIVADSAIIAGCAIFALALKQDGFAFLRDASLWWALVPLIMLTIFAFHAFGLYRSVIRYISTQSLQAVAASVIFSGTTLLLVSQAFAAPVPPSVVVVYAVLLFLTVGGVRLALRTALRQPMNASRQPIAIYGAGEAGRQLQIALIQGLEYAPVAFFDDDPALHQTLVAGCPVYAPAKAPDLIRDLGVKAILLAIPSASRGRRRQILAKLEPLGVEINTIPGMVDIVSGRATYSELRRVTPEDLLGRDPVPPRADLMRRNIVGKVVLVSGAGGSIGSELCRQIIRCSPRALVLLEVSEFSLYRITTELRETLAREGRTLPIEPVLCSVQNLVRVRSIIATFGVQTVYHAAAYKHVVLVEENVVEGIVNNVFGTQVMVQAAVEAGVERFILISTDKAVRPTNFMGASKRMAELVCQAAARERSRTRISMVRFGNVLGSSGSVIPRFEAQIEQGGPVTVTHRDITRYFMTIPEAAQLVIQAGAMARGGDVFVLDMGEPVKILDLAQSMIRLHGLKPYILDAEGQPETGLGDVPIKIVGLGKGEKLYEELLIGNNPRPTEHPRIRSASEVSLSQADLLVLLDRLKHACDTADVAALRRIFLEAPLSYQPTTGEIHDRVWNLTLGEAYRNQPKAVGL